MFLKSFYFYLLMAGKSAYDSKLEKDLFIIKNSIRTIPNFPKKGIMFRDITTLIGNREVYGKTIDMLYRRYRNLSIDVVAGIESRGFIFGGSLAYKLNAKFVPVRKPGKLPYETIKQEYSLEYGSNSLEIHRDAIKKGERVLIVDDLLATGGTAEAAANLVERLEGNILGCAFIIGLPALKGRERLSKRNVYTMVDFEGE